MKTQDVENILGNVLRRDPLLKGKKRQGDFIRACVDGFKAAKLIKEPIYLEDLPSTIREMLDGMDDEYEGEFCADTADLIEKLRDILGRVEP